MTSFSSSVNKLSSKEYLQQIAQIQNAVVAHIDSFEERSKRGMGISLTKLPIRLAFDAVSFPHLLLQTCKEALEKLQTFDAVPHNKVQAMVRKVREYLKDQVHHAEMNIKTYEVFVPFLLFYWPIYNNTRSLQDKYSPLYEKVFDPSKCTLLPKVDKKTLDQLQKENSHLIEQLDLARKTLDAYKKKINPPDPVKKMIATEQRNLLEMLEIVQLNAKTTTFSQFYFPYAQQVQDLKKELSRQLSQAIDPATKKLKKDITQKQAEEIKEKFTLLTKKAQEVKALLKNHKNNPELSIEEREQAGLEIHNLTKLLETLTHKVKIFDAYLKAAQPLQIKPREAKSPKIKEEPPKSPLFTLEAPKEQAIPFAPEKRVVPSSTISPRKPAATTVKTPPSPEAAKTPPKPLEKIKDSKIEKATTLHSLTCVEKLKTVWAFFVNILQWIITCCKKEFPSFAKLIATMHKDPSSQLKNSALPKIPSPESQRQESKAENEAPNGPKPDSSTSLPESFKASSLPASKNQESNSVPLRPLVSSQETKASSLQDKSILMEEKEQAQRFAHHEIIPLVLEGIENPYKRSELAEKIHKKITAYRSPALAQKESEHEIYSTIQTWVDEKISSLSLIIEEIGTKYPVSSEHQSQLLKAQKDLTGTIDSHYDMLQEFVPSERLQKWNEPWQKEIAIADSIVHNYCTRS